MNRDIRPHRYQGAGATNYNYNQNYNAPRPSFRPPQGLPQSPRQATFMQSQRQYGRNEDRAPNSLRERGYGRQPNTLSSDSTASTTSSGSSFLDRMKVRSTDTSTRTSFEDDYNDSRVPTRGGGWAKQRQPVKERNWQEEEEDTPPTVSDPNSAGNTLWGRMVAAAGSLTVNVSKAWENGINLQDGEETPPGGESRLTRAMKAYYIERARAPSDLPPWLFDERERQPTQSSRAAAPSWARNRDGRDAQNSSRSNNNAASSRRGGRGGYEEEEYQSAYEQPTRGALRDIYDKASSTQKQSRATPNAFRDDQAIPSGESKATSRLKAFRDQKRLQVGGASGNSGMDNSYGQDDGYDRGTSRGGGGGRLGLPENDDYGGYGSGRRPIVRSDLGPMRPSFDDGDRRAPPRAPMGLPTGPRQRRT